jgi:hypothetical protein
MQEYSASKKKIYAENNLENALIKHAQTEQHAHKIE